MGTGLSSKHGHYSFLSNFLDDGQPDGFVDSSVDPSDGVADEPDLLDLQQLEQVDPSGDHPVLLARLLQRQDLPVKPIFCRTRPNDFHHRQ